MWMRVDAPLSPSMRRTARRPAPSTSMMLVVPVRRIRELLSLKRQAPIAVSANLALRWPDHASGWAENARGRRGSMQTRCASLDTFPWLPIRCWETDDAHVGGKTSAGTSIRGNVPWVGSAPKISPDRLGKTSKEGVILTVFEMRAGITDVITPEPGLLSPCVSGRAVDVTDHMTRRTTESVAMRCSSSPSSSV